MLFRLLSLAIIIITEGRSYAGTGRFGDPSLSPNAAHFRTYTSLPALRSLSFVRSYLFPNSRQISSRHLRDGFPLFLFLPKGNQILHVPVNYTKLAWKIRDLIIFSQADSDISISFPPDLSGGILGVSFSPASGGLVELNDSVQWSLDSYKGNSLKSIIILAVLVRSLRSCTYFRDTCRI